jgi:hypothetical protein
MGHFVDHYPHFGWAFGAKEFSSPVEVSSLDFRFWFNPSLPRQQLSFREECRKAALLLRERSKGATLALCYSGGRRSEALAYCLRELGIPFEAYFLDIWGVNGKVFRDRRAQFEREFGKPVTVVHLDRQRFYDGVSRPLFRKFGIDAPTYLAMTELFRAIPGDQFIVTGDGDLQRQGRAYEYWGKLNPGAKADSLPFLPSSVFYYLWSKESGREGEFYFYRSTPGLVAAQVQHPDFVSAYPLAETNGVFAEAFPEVSAREKSNNWGRESYQENVWIREWLEQDARERRIGYWRDDAGSVVNVSQLFK